jgi:hypothetical protein
VATRYRHADPWIRIRPPWTPTRARAHAPEGVSPVAGLYTIGRSTAAQPRLGPARLRLHRRSAPLAPNHPYCTRQGPVTSRPLVH